MTGSAPILMWFRRDLRLSDHPAVAEAARSGRPVIPVFLHDECVERLGAAPRFRLGLGVGRFAEGLAGTGSRLILRRGRALPVLRRLVAETGAGAVWWTRLYDPDARARDTEVKAALREDGIEARSFPGHLLFEPWEVETGTGGFYKVYTPMWRAVRDRPVAAPDGAPARLPGPERWPASERLDDWGMDRAMARGRDIVASHAGVGEAAAAERLGAFVAGRIADYREARDRPGEDGTSSLSENLTTGEIGPRTCWHAGLRARDEGRAGAETFLQELVWREFAYHLMHHTPRLVSENWREDWSGFPWREDRRLAPVRAWERGRTGIPFVDAGMRQMYVTGRMHNRARMVAGSWLTKNLMTHWRVGLRWFEEHLTDWDPASNALGWQWVAGSGPDAAPYFRIFNPLTQAERFDPDGTYARRWIAEGQARPPATALAYFDAIPESWGMRPDQPYPRPDPTPKESRQRALDAYGGFRDTGRN